MLYFVLMILLPTDFLGRFYFFNFNFFYSTIVVPSGVKLQFVSSGKEA